MRLIVYKNSFKKELVLMQRRGKNIEEIKKVISALQQDIPLAEKNKTIPSLVIGSVLESVIYAPIGF